MSAKKPVVPKSRAEQKLAAFHDEDNIDKSYDFQLLARLWPFIRPHAKYVVISLTALVCVAGVNLLRPILMGRVVSHAGAKEAELLLRDGALLAGLVVLSQIISFGQIYCMQLAGALSMADLRRHVFHFLQGLSMRFFDKTPVGRLTTRCTNDVDSVSELFAFGVFNAVGDLLMLVGIVVAMLLLDWQLSLIAFAALPVVGLLVSWVRRCGKRAYRDIRTKTARLNALLAEQVGGIAVVGNHPELRERLGQRAVVGRRSEAGCPTGFVCDGGHVYPIPAPVLRAGQHADAALHGAPECALWRRANLPAAR